MRLKLLTPKFTICSLPLEEPLPCPEGIFSLTRTDEELSLVCETTAAPASALHREDGWRAFRFEGTLDFSLTGILAAAAQVLAEQKIPIFAVSTYNTDYILLKENQLARAACALSAAGYELT